MQNSKPIYQSKTLWFNVLYILSIVVADDHFKDLFKDYGSYLVIAQTVINILLRFVTDKPVTIRPKAEDVLKDALNDDLKDF